MPVTSDALKEVMRQWASGVTVVTTANDTQRAGVTASSFTSVSLEPPLILVCLYHELDITQQIEHNGHFAVSLLGTEQGAISNQMAGFGDIPEGEDRFYGLDWTTQATGAPVLSNSVGWLDCTLHAMHTGGTHKIVVGQVTALGGANDGMPLVYFNQRYYNLHPQS